MFEDLSRKHALVTGASSGLGARFARILASVGAQVTLAARRLEALEPVVEEIKERGGEVNALCLDVSEIGSIDAAVAALNCPVDILINNAGVSCQSPAMQMTEDDWDVVLNTNLKGAFLLSQAVARSMRERGDGAIVNVASILGLRIAGNVASYAVSKAGLVQLTKVLALEWARFGIRVNALCPGYIETDLNREFFETDAGQALVKRIPQRRLGCPEDLDVPLLLLCSAAGRYMTGSTLVVDGGHLISSL
jgi:NAD(P)-dependent dehydrogenase (short-subunit alcohol dehydrogenase family)